MNAFALIWRRKGADEWYLHEVYGARETALLFYRKLSAAHPDCVLEVVVTDLRVAGAEQWQLGELEHASEL
jgi:hypothetical protein